MTYRRPVKGTTYLGRTLITLFGLTAAASGTAILVGLALINFIVAGFFWPDIINAVLILVGKVPAATWWMGVLIGFIPVFGRWYITLIVYSLTMLFL